MKKFLSVFLSIIFAVSLAACGGNNTQNTNSGNSSVPQNNTSAADDNSVGNKKTLVVYFSATGNTENAAKIIAETLNADIFEIVPQEPYTDADLNWNNSNSRVSVEHTDESKRNVPLVKTTPDNFEQYDTVYIGYPIWWGIAAWPVDSFVKSNDFTGKTVIPFCTSASSGLGNSDKLLKDSAGSGNWEAGKRFSSAVTESEIANWVK